MSKLALTRKTPKNHKLQPEDAFTSRFYGLLGRLVHAHARLDFNIGLQLKWMGPHLNQDVTGLLRATTPFAQRLTKLEELSSALFANAEPQALDELRAWFNEAARLKHVRNGYVHGRWGVPRNFSETPLRIEFVPLDWNLDPGTAPTPSAMTIEELEQEVAALQHLAGEYFRLSRKYARWAVARVGGV